MNKKEIKKIASVLSGAGCGVKVIDGDLGFALRQWKRDTKNSKKIQSLFERQQYIKPSVLKRQQKQLAIFRQQKESGK